MKIDCDALDAHLAGRLAPVYLLSGDEPLQLQEAADAVRNCARERGYDERRVMHIDASFDWSLLAVEACSPSLFAEKRLLELRLPSAKPGREGGQALVRYAEHPAADVLLLLVTGRLDGNALKSVWCRSLERAGVLLRVWPVEAPELPGWVERRMRRCGLQPERAAAGLLAECVEGNLLAAAQEIDKLELLHGKGPVSADDVLGVVGDSARFDAFGLVDDALSGDVARAVRALGGLRREGVPAIQFLGVLVFELRRLCQIAAQVRGGQRPAALFQRFRVWGARRQTAIRRGLERHEATVWPMLLARCAKVDKAIKGLGPGNPWDELQAICVRIAAPGRRRSGGRGAG